MRKEGDRIVENPIEARAGFRDRPVLVVLAASTLLLIVVFGAIYLANFGS